MPRRVVGGGIGMLLLVAVALFLGIDPSDVVNTGIQPAGNTEPYSGSQPAAPEEDRLADFVAVVLGDTEDTWRSLFRQMGQSYQEPSLVLFSGAVDSACGFAQAATGPFYCPRDRKVYLDLNFFEDLQNRFGAPGDFAQAYVIAHEIGHHVQKLLGIADQVDALRSRVGEIQGNRLSVMLELQADCLAGVWAHHAQRARHILEKGDIEEALNAASAIGDDRIQRGSRGYITPDTFTHGSSGQRVYWFRQGIMTGDIDRCNTFAADRP
jgi:hypothetical protein